MVFNDNARFIVRDSLLATLKIVYIYNSHSEYEEVKLKYKFTK